MRSMNKSIIALSIIGIVVCILYLFYTFFIDVQLISPIKTREEIVNDNIQRLKDNYSTLDAQQIKERSHVAYEPPEINRLRALLEDFKSNQSWSSVIAMADIYRKGAFPRYLPNESLAIDLYRTVSMCPDGEMAGTAQLKYVETRKEIIANDDKAGQPLPISYGEEALSVATVYIQRTPMTAFDKPHFKAPLQVKLPHQTQPPEQHTILENEPLFDLDTLFERRHTTDITTPYKSDSQNVHDHSVVQAAKENIKRLKNSIGDQPQNSNNSVESVTDSILSASDLTDKQRLNALEVLEKLSTSKHSTLDISERDALDLVYRKISSTQDPTLRENLKETLAKQLSSARESGYTVCSTGKIARILGTLDGVESTNTTPMKPMWAIKEEIGNMATKIREEHLSKMSSHEQNNYSDQQAQSMRHDFENKAKSLYVNELGMKDSIISPIIDLYAEGF